MVSIFLLMNLLVTICSTTFSLPLQQPPLTPHPTDLLVYHDCLHKLATTEVPSFSVKIHALSLLHAPLWYQHLPVLFLLPEDITGHGTSSQYMLQSIFDLCTPPLLEEVSYLLLQMLYNRQKELQALYTELHHLCEQIAEKQPTPMLPKNARELITFIEKQGDFSTFLAFSTHINEPNKKALTVPDAARNTLAFCRELFSYYTSKRFSKTKSTLLKGLLTQEFITTVVMPFIHPDFTSLPKRELQAFQELQKVVLHQWASIHTKQEFNTTPLATMLAEDVEKVYTMLKELYQKEK